jgi:hypothetical protein
MPDVDLSNILDEDQVEIKDLDPLDDGSSASLSIVLLKTARKIPLLANTRSRSTTLALLACVLVLLFLVQPGSPDFLRQTPGTSAQTAFNTVDDQSSPTIIGTSAAHAVIWIRISNGEEIVIQTIPGKIAWHHCKVQRWFTPPKYTHQIVVLCT